MQREIKFRVWDKTLNQWVNHISALNAGGTLLYLSAAVSDAKEIKHNIFTVSPGRSIIQQFTGLKDKNNKEIYEGDLVKTDANHVNVLLRADGCPEYTCGEVRWLCEAFKVCQKYIGASHIGDYASCDCHPCGLEIIGNIFENSELLENK